MIALRALTRVGALLGALLPVSTAAATLPARLAPSAPFPRILSQAPTIETIAPGVEFATYQLLTASGPLVIHAIAADLHRADVHVGTVLADNALVSHGETVGAMADRTGAIAGINGDYFAIGSTDSPTNIVVRDGQLLRMPRKRYAVAITTHGNVDFTEFHFAGQVQLPTRALALDAIDEVPPPDGGVALVTPAFGPLPPLENVTEIPLAPVSGTPPLATYTTGPIADNDAAQPAGYYLAIGPSAYGITALPNPGESVVASGDLAPISLTHIAAAIGGGPLILDDGTWIDDPDGPSGGEFDRPIPSSGVATTADGTLLLIEVDGRQPLESVGITRPQFAALMRALGAVEGMALDGGGSSTIVARRLGDTVATLQNSPSDGRERPVADGLFVYSTAPAGPAVRLVAQPGTIRAVAGAAIALRMAAVDAARHVVPPPAPIQSRIVPARLGRLLDGRFIAAHSGIGEIVMRAGDLIGHVPLEVTRSPASLAIVPAAPDVDRGGTLQFHARAFDRHGYPLALPDLLPWKAQDGRIDPRGRFQAGTRNAAVALAIGAARATTPVTVGTHTVVLPFAANAHFTTIPRGGAGSLVADPACGCLRLHFAFAADERAAYAIAVLPLPAQTVGLAFDVDDDGSGARLKVAVRNAIGEDAFVKVTVLDRPGWRRVEVRFPPAATHPAKLVGIYVLAPRGTEMAAGAVGLREVHAIVAGAPR